MSFFLRDNSRFPGKVYYPATPIFPSALAEEKELPLDSFEKITVSYSDVDEYFTVQKASYTNGATVERGYAILENKLHEEDLDHRRIEVVGSYHTLRLGKFE